MNLMLRPTLPQKSGCVLSSRSQELHLSGGCRGKMGRRSCLQQAGPAV